MDGRVVVITGANTGIGKDTANELYKRGATVVVLCRSEERAAEAVDWIKEDSKDSDGSIRFEKCNLGSVESVKKCAEKLNESLDKIDILVNNAGVYWGKDERATTEDGFELTFAVNHLGHFLLTELVLPLLKKSAETGYTPRIINVSSAAYEAGKMNWDDLNAEKRSFSGFRTYSNSKLANVLHAKELAKRAGDTGIVAFSVHPGFVKTDIGRNNEGSCIRGFVKIAGFIGLQLTSSQGAQTTLYCCLDDSITDRSGSYFANCKEKRLKQSLTSDEDAKRLWEESEKLLDMTSQLD